MSFTNGNKDGKHYWLTPDDLMSSMQSEFKFNFDSAPFPKPDDFDGKKKGPTAWVRKAIEENKKGKSVVLIYPVDKWILMMIEAGAEIRNLKDVKWLATEDRSQGPGIGRHIAQFILRGNK